MLREVPDVKQVKDEPRRRWFYGPTCELMVWLDDADTVVKFQFSYDKDAIQHALTWEYPNLFQHTGIDSGETHPLKPKATPIHVGNGVFDGARVFQIFQEASMTVPEHYAATVSEQIVRFAMSTKPGRRPAARSAT